MTMLLRPQVIELPDGPVTAFPDVMALQSGAVVEAGWLGSPDEPEALATLRRDVEAAQRAETEDTYTGCTVRHFDGGSLIFSPAGGGSTRVSVIFYGLSIEPGEWRPLGRYAQGP